MTDFVSQQRIRGDGGLAGSGWRGKVVKRGIDIDIDIIRFM